MAKFWNVISEFFMHYIWGHVQTMGVADVLDVLILTACFYGAYAFGRVRRAGKLFVGLGLLLVLYLLTGAMNLRATHQLLSSVMSFGIIVLAIIFQPEIRDGLTRLGSAFIDLRSGGGKHADVAYIVSEVAEAACNIAGRTRDGALIVLERQTGLKEYVEKGEKLDAEVSAKLLTNIFVDRSPLHDGAVVIRDGRVAAAGCKLRLSSNEEVAAGLGTRHRAALGVTEDSDCVVVVVSEERHTISVANDGLLKRDYNRGLEDMDDKEVRKDVQNRLRQDLFLLMTGQPIESVNQEAIEQEKQKRHGRPERKQRAFRFAHRDNNTGSETTEQGEDDAPAQSGEADADVHS